MSYIHIIKIHNLTMKTFKIVVFGKGESPPDLLYDLFIESMKQAFLWNKNRSGGHPS